MTELIVALSSGKGTWGHVAGLIKQENWDKIFLITNEFGKQNFKIPNTEYIVIEPNQYTTPLLAEAIRKKLEGRIRGLEVGLNLVSGSGREHMAILSALLKLGIGIRLVVLSQEGVKEL